MNVWCYIYSYINHYFEKEAEAHLTLLDKLTFSRKDALILDILDIL